MPTDPRALGTFNQVDRSKQYTRLDNAELLRSLNEAWAKIRILEKARAADAKIIAALKKENRVFRVKNIVLTSILTGLAWEGLKAIAPMLLRYLGIF